MSREHVFVFCYDVASDKVRRRLADILEDKGTRVQKSVFEVRATRALRRCWHGLRPSGSRATACACIA
jgi:CRISPR-associated endonuclease Cas2